MLYLVSILGSFLTLVMAMILVAFFILTERKVLGYIQLRKGPNKVGLLGLLQSFSDLIKLVVKVKVIFFENRSWFSWFGLFLFVMIVSLFCVFISSCYLSLNTSLSLLWVLVYSGLTGYSILSIGWGCYNKYGWISAVRCCFGSITFEAYLMTLVVLIGSIISSYRFQELMNSSWLFSVVFPPVFYFWLFHLLSECGRVPFDYLESESEAVSGINVEYCSVPFVCLFACEYLNMFILCWFSASLFFGGFLVVPLAFFFLFFFAWCRGTFLRARYDFFSDLMWRWSLVIVVVLLYTVF